MGYKSDSKYRSLSAEQRKVLKASELIRIRRIVDKLPAGVSIRSAIAGSGIRTSNVSAFLSGNLDALSLDNIDRLEALLKSAKKAQRHNGNEDLPSPRFHMWICKRARRLAGTESLSLANLAVTAAGWPADDLETPSCIFLHMIMKRRVRAYEKLWRDPRWGGVFEEALEAIDPEAIEEQAATGALPRGLPDCIVDVLQRYRTVTRARELKAEKAAELARFVDTMIRNHDLSLKGVAELTGVYRQSLAKFVRLARLPLPKGTDYPFSTDTMARIAQEVQARYMAAGDPELPDVSREALHPELA